MARPRKNIDPEQVRKLAGLGLTQKDIASFVGCSQSLISLRFSSSYDLGVTQLKTGLNKVMGRNLIAWV
jgi:predicted transcriptional regulator